MKVLGLAALIIFSIVMIYIGSRNSRTMLEDHTKYGGNELIKAISEYNKKNNALSGYVGEPGVTRTPLQSYDNVNTKSSAKARQQRPSALQPPPPVDQYGQQLKPSTTPVAPSTNSYYPPPPLQQPESGNMQAPYPPGSENREFKLPMDLPRSGPPDYLRSGQPIAYQADVVYTFDKNGKPAPLPDGTYEFSDGRPPLYVKDSKLYLVEQ
jgi:hypothetical protein